MGKVDKGPGPAVGSVQCVITILGFRVIGFWGFRCLGCGLGFIGLRAKGLGFIVFRVLGLGVRAWPLGLAFLPALRSEWKVPQTDSTKTRRLP